MSAAEAIPDDLELVPDDLELVDDASTPEREYQAREAGFAADRQKGTAAQRAMNALAKMKAGGQLAPDEAEAIRTAMRGDFGKRGDTPMSALEAANLKGISGLTLGHADEMAGGVRAGVKKLAGDKRKLGDVYTDERDTVRSAMAQASRDQPGVSMASEAMGGLPAAIALPGGLAGSIGTGVITGAGAAETSQPLDLIGSSALGGLAGGIGYGAAKVIPPALKAALEGGKRITGQGMQKLAQLLGEKPIERAAQAVTPDAPPSFLASLEDQLSDAASANVPRATTQVTQTAQAAAPVAADKTGNLMIRELENMEGRNVTPDKFAQYAQEVNAQAIKNDPALANMRAPNIDEEALLKLQAMFDEKGLQPPKMQPRGPKGTAVADPAMEVATAAKGKPIDAPEWPLAGTDDQLPWKDDLDMVAMPMNETPTPDVAPKAPFSPGQDSVKTWMEGNAAKSEYGRNAATFDNANKSIDWKRADEIMRGGRGMDPRSGERGFIGLGDAYAGVKAMGAAGKAAAPYMNRAGAALEDSASKAMSPEAQARSYIANPSVLFHLARQQGAVGGAAKSMLEALQAGDQTGLKARAALLAAMPEFRLMFVQGKASEGPPASIAR